MSQTRPLAEKDFRGAFEEALAVIKTIGPQCQSIEELTGLLELAVGDEHTPGNDAQLRILLKLMKAVKT